MDRDRIGKFKFIQKFIGLLYHSPFIKLYDHLFCEIIDLSYDSHISIENSKAFIHSVTDKGNGHKVTVDADETFDKGVLWQQDAENFVCMEPWNGWANSVNEEGKHEVLDVDEAMTSEWSITIEKV